jgi:hypothetical protein
VRIRFNSARVTMSIADRPPSSAWEQWPPSPAAPYGLWLWYRPQHAPQGVMLRLPDETFRNPAIAGRLTIRSLLGVLGINPPELAAWSVCGTAYECRQGTNPLLDAPLPAPVPGVDPTILLQFAAPDSPASVPENPLATLDRIAGDWRASLQLEHQLELARKLLCDAQHRLHALNRDLTPDERLHADRMDQNEWQDARRWLRDVDSRLSKLIKEHDIGMASAAGRRNWFESIYQQVIAPRRPCEGLDAIRREFEQYRKTVQTMLLHMNSAQTMATQDGERRAQQVLTRIAAKVRAARAKR